MKKDDVKVGATYLAKVNGGVVPVRITGEKWTGDKHVGWIGVNTQTNRSVRIKTAQRLRAPVLPQDGGGGENAAGGAALPQDGGGAVAAAAGSPRPPSGKAAKTAGKGGGTKKAAATPKTGATKAVKAPKAPKEPKPAKPKKTSALDAAAIVLAAAGAPMKAKEMIATMEAKGLWTSPGGKTPEATLYAAIIREIAAKGREARFRKTERGTFVATEHAVTTSANAGAANV